MLPSTKGVKQAWKLKSLVTIILAMTGLVVEDSLQWDKTMPTRPEKTVAASAMAQ
jgi:hypothetical protein